MKKVLIVEDEFIIAADEKRILEKLGYQVTRIVGTAEEALQYADQDGPDLVLMDVRLRQTGMDGVDVATIIRQRHGTPVVFATAYTTDSVLERAAETSPYGFLVKPFGEDDIRSTLRIAFARRAMELALKESEGRFRALIENGTEVIVVVDRDGYIRYASPSVDTKLGYNPDEQVGRSITEILRPAMRQRTRDLIANLADGSPAAQLPVRLRFRRGDGAPRILEGTISDQLSDPAIEGFVFNLRDVTERWEAERNRYRLLQELTRALDQVKTLEGILPICAYCKKIRTDTDEWKQVEVYVRDRTEANFSHTICPDCEAEHFPAK